MAETSIHMEEFSLPTIFDMCFKFSSGLKLYPLVLRKRTYIHMKFFCTYGNMEEMCLFFGLKMGGGNLLYAARQVDLNSLELPNTKHQAEHWIHI